MTRKLAVAQLPDPIRDAVDAAVREGRATIDEITAMIHGMGGKVSRSAVGNYVKRANERMERYRQTQEVARQFADRLSGAGDAAQVSRQVITAAIFDLVNGLTSTGNDEDQLNLKALATAARTLRDVAASAKIDAEARRKIREELKEEMAQEMAELADQAESPDGKIDAETLRQMIRESYGV